MTELSFRKSSYSGASENCVEVAEVPAGFRKSSYSGETGGNCVEVAHIPAGFRTSSYSGGNNECVEVGALPYGAAIRDSKHPDAGHLPFPASEWASFLSSTLK